MRSVQPGQFADGFIIGNRNLLFSADFSCGLLKKYAVFKKHLDMGDFSIGFTELSSGW
jgi:hypothetical protein